MRFMILLKANADTESGRMPRTEELEEMGRYNEQLVKAGVLLAGEGLHPSALGARVRLLGAERTVTDGPFAETTQLVAGFWMLQVGSREEAIEWVKRCPLQDAEIEIRQVFEAEDFGEAFTPEQREAEERLREEIARQA